MYFDFRTYFRFLYLAFFKGRSVHFKMTFRRFAGLLLFFLLFPIFELFTAICLLLDHVLFPGFRRVKLETPLFIVGPHRSGTTYVQRLLAKDEEQFFCFRSWEIMFPSILQKKVLSALGRLDRALGRPMEKAIRRHEARKMGSYHANIHELSFFEPEEDDKLTLHTFSTLALMWFVHPGELDWLLYFDERASRRDKDRIMRFYRECLRRQAYFKGGRRILVSKAPFACLRVRSLREYFPGCRLIYTLRDPLTAVPSMLDVAKKYWETTANLNNWDVHQAWLYPTIHEMYRYPLANFEESDPATCEVIVHNDLLRRPRETIRACLLKFGYNVSPAFDDLLKAEDERQRNFQSRHVTSLEAFNLTPEKIRDDFKDVYEKYTFA
ncbi:MAG: sulfotransferase [bacterium]